jgi:hypothetical protein
VVTERKRQSGTLADPLDEWADREYPVAEDMAFQRASWIIERIGWGLIVALMLAALLGLFSMGVLSGAKASDGSGALSVEYERFHRNGAGDVMEVTLTPLDGSGAVLHLDARFLRAFTIDSVTPEPAEWRGDESGATLHFPQPEGRRFQVHFSLRPEQVGLVNSRITLGRPADNGPAVDLKMFIYP